MSRSFPDLLACGLAVLVTGMAGSGVSADDASSPSEVHVGSASGAELYSSICQGCHMPQAQGAVGAGHYPRLAGDPALVSAQYVALTVLNGKNGMPPFGLPDEQAAVTLTVHLSDAEIANVVNYVRSNFGNHFKDAVSSAQVAALPHPGANANATPE